MFDTFIAHESSYTLISSFHINPTALSEKNKPPLSYNDKNDILCANCDNIMHSCNGNDKVITILIHKNEIQIQKAKFNHIWGEQ